MASDLLAEALTWLDEVRRDSLSRPALYERPGAGSVELAVTPGSTTYEVADEAGATIEAKATDFIAAAADLVLAGRTVKPRLGDRITLTIGGEAQVFEVLELAGAGCWAPLDPAGTMLRIHAKRIEP